MTAIGLEKTKDSTLAKAFFEDKLAFTTGPVTLHHLIENGVPGDIQIIDVRAAEDYKKSHIPGAINMPEDKWHKLSELNANKINIVYCYNITCHLGATAALQFASAGYPVMELEGGFDKWQQYGFDVVHGEKNFTLNKLGLEV